MHGPGAPATFTAVINSSPRSEFQDALSDVVDEDDPERGHEATRVINDMAKQYMGVDEYPLRAPSGEVRSLFVISPTRVSTFN